MGNPKTLIPIKKGEVRNTKGRPRVLITQVLLDLKAAGIEPAQPSDIKRVFLMLVNTTNPELKKLSEDVNQSYLVRTVAKALIGKKGFEILEKILDRSMGKAAQEIQMKMSPSELSNMSDEELLERINQLSAADALDTGGQRPEEGQAHPAPKKAATPRAKPQKPV
jgi:hypothetical protein